MHTRMQARAGSLAAAAAAVLAVLAASRPAAEAELIAELPDGGALALLAPSSVRETRTRAPNSNC
jgi:hypothetical protein